MIDISTALSQIALQQQVQLSVVSQAMDFQESNGAAVIEAMAELPQAQDPIRGNVIDISI